MTPEAMDKMMNSDKICEPVSMALVSFSFGILVTFPVPRLRMRMRILKSYQWKSCATGMQTKLRNKGEALARLAEKIMKVILTESAVVYLFWVFSLFFFDFFLQSDAFSSTYDTIATLLLKIATVKSGKSAF